MQIKSSGESLTLAPPQIVGSGGEARVFAVRDAGKIPLVAKIWHEPTPLKARKLAAMLRLPAPASRSGNTTGTDDSHVSVAWPIDTLIARRRPDDPGVVVGYLMPQAVGTRRLIDFYNPAVRRANSPNFTYRYLIRTARNLAAAVTSLHARGVAIGDVNESNILVSETALVTLVDTDSFQVRDFESGDVFRCRVGKLEYTPPELQMQKFGEIDLTPAHDRFGLAVLLFQTLMEGTHPFSGVFRGDGEPPTLPARIRAGHFPYVDSVMQAPAVFDPMPTAPPVNVLPPTVRDLFYRCFVDGHRNAAQRPTANEWREALDRAERQLRTCDANANHQFGMHLVQCPWCVRAEALGGRDPFPQPAPSESAVLADIRDELGAVATESATDIILPPVPIAPLARPIDPHWYRVRRSLEKLRNAQIVMLAGMALLAVGMAGGFTTPIGVSLVMVSIGGQCRATADGMRAPRRKAGRFATASLVLAYLLPFFLITFPASMICYAEFLRALSDEFGAKTQSATVGLVGLAMLIFLLGCAAVLKFTPLVGFGLLCCYVLYLTVQIFTLNAIRHEMPDDPAYV